MIIVASVTMTEDSSLNLVMRIPLIRPQTVATARHRRAASGMGRPAWNATAMITAESVTVEATEMSIMPRMMTMVIGRTRNAMSRNVCGVERNVSAVK